MEHAEYLNDKNVKFTLTIDVYMSFISKLEILDENSDNFQVNRGHYDRVVFDDSVSGFRFDFSLSNPNLNPSDNDVEGVDKKTISQGKLVDDTDDVI